MTEKKTERTKTRDECVRSIAEDLKRDNWLVKANAEGWEKPSAIGGFIPDVLAQKGCLKRICEVASEKDFEGNRAQYRDFKNYCKEYDFHFYVRDENGKLKPIDLETLTNK